MGKNGIFLAVSFIGLLGCAAMLPPIQNQHPNGYSKLLPLQPECQNPDLKNYTACLSAAKMFESTSPEQATAIFVAHWEEVAFGTAARKEQIGEARYLPRDQFLESGVWGKVKFDSIQATKKITLPVLKKIYQDTNNNPYCLKMLKQLDLIILESKSSFDSFREIHTKSSMN